MSYELIFWRQTILMSQSSKAIYDCLNEGRPVDGLGELPIEEILSRVVDNFAGAQRQMVRRSGLSGTDRTERTRSR